MDESKQIRALRLVLKFGATVFGLSALALLAVPRVFTDLLGLVGTEDLDWAMRMIGITLVALCGQMFSVSMFGNERGVLVSASVMQIAAFGLGIITLLIPVNPNLFVLGYAAIGFGFSFVYTYLIIQLRVTK
ncbi:hypothetical protein [Candidatus Aquiluna sp. UB-MaderosW2red]|jgi:hypothetical protein|uniref:hypothetical protein n=1 Tax=Candidatus Aquiluna sp. UB-MaderosW2red TaxID=1855377 RepID=UPI000875E58A|nr:hypothetical protein [Candidatus Aquiluna sp. UB-MaderosW2red]SCX05119.1 hypothetical protein SAMN05216534_0348 [Candidatus Aquiluna sp. UB-MaderosW2red]